MEWYVSIGSQSGALTAQNQPYNVELFKYLSSCTDLLCGRDNYAEVTVEGAATSVLFFTFLALTAAAETPEKAIKYKDPPSSDENPVLWVVWKSINK